MKKASKQISKVLSIFLCALMTFVVCACSDLDKPNTPTQPQKPTTQQVVEANVYSGGPLDENNGTYSIVYENVQYTLQNAGFTTSASIAFDYDNANKTKIAPGLMYYFDDLNLFSTEKYYAAGFYEILPEGAKTSKFEKTENLYLYNAEENSNRMYLGVYDYEDIGADHLIFENKYIIYYQESENTIRYTEMENKRENYDLSLGSLYDYDRSRYVYDPSFLDGVYEHHSGIELNEEDEDYIKLQEQLNKMSAEQEKKGYEVTEFSTVYISPESVQAYIDSQEQDTFFGYNVDDIVSEFGLGTALRYTENGFERATILNPGQPGYNWKSFLTKVAIGSGIILVGAILTPLTGGASFGCALVTISKIALTTAAAAMLEPMVMTAIEGLIDGKNILDVLKGSVYAGLDAFANGFMIGAAIGSVGVATRLIKPKACFVGGTSVALANNKYKAIKDIKVGDNVLSFNEQTKQVSSQKVLETFKHSVNQTLKIKIDGKIIETTPNHPFYLPMSGGWANAEDLKIGDIVLTSSKQLCVIDDIEVVNHLEMVDVYNFTVENNHTYFVGEDKILVHNLCDAKLDRARAKAGKQAKKQALDDIIENRNLRKWGLDPSNPNDLEVIEFVQKNKRFPSFANGDGIQCDFAHAIDVKDIKKACLEGKITEAQAYEMAANPKNGLLTSRKNHYLLHNGKWTNSTNVQAAVKARPCIKETINILLEILM